MNTAKCRSIDLPMSELQVVHLKMEQCNAQGGHPPTAQTANHNSDYWGFTVLGRLPGIETTEKQQSHCNRHT